MSVNFPAKPCVYSKIECQQLTLFKRKFSLFIWCIIKRIFGNQYKDPLKESFHFLFDALSREFWGINIRTQKPLIPCFYSFYNILRDFLMHSVFDEISHDKKEKNMFTSINFSTASESISVKLKSSLTELVSETALKPVITFSTPACQKLCK